MFYSFHCTSLVGVFIVKFIPISLFLDAIVFLVSFSDCSLLMYRNTLFLYTYILQLCLSSSFPLNSFLVGFLLFSMYKIIASANRGNFTSFSVWMPLLSFSCLISLVGVSSTVSGGKHGRFWDFNISP